MEINCINPNCGPFDNCIPGCPPNIPGHLPGPDMPGCTPMPHLPEYMPSIPGCDPSMPSMPPQNDYYGYCKKMYYLYMHMAYANKAEAYKYKMMSYDQAY